MSIGSLQHSPLGRNKWTTNDTNSAYPANQIYGRPQITDHTKHHAIFSDLIETFMVMCGAKLKPSMFAQIWYANGVLYRKKEYFATIKSSSLTFSRDQKPLCLDVEWPWNYQKTALFSLLVCLWAYWYEPPSSLDQFPLLISPSLDQFPQW